MAVPKVKGVVFLIKREGEGGKLGPFKAAARVIEPSPVIYHLLNDNYYISGPMEYKAETGLEPYDFDGDGDYDGTDLELMEKIRKANMEIAASHAEDVEAGAIQSPEERSDAVNA